MAFLIAAVIVLCGLLFNIRLHVSICVEQGRACLFARARVFFGLVPLRVHACLSFSPLRLHMRGKAKDIVFRLNEKKDAPLVRALLRRWKSILRVDSLRVRGAVGSAEDACAAIRWAGALSILLECAARVLLDPEALQMRLVPLCGARCFCLNLEGILTIRAWQIIGVAIRQQISGTRGK